MRTAKAVFKPHNLLSFLLIGALCLGVCGYRADVLRADEPAVSVITEDSSLLLGDASSHYVMPVSEGFTYNKLNLHSIYVMVREISPLGTIDYLRSNEHNRAHMGAFTQLMSYYVFQQYFHEMKINDEMRIEISEEDLIQATRLGGRIMGFVPGESFKLKDLFYAMLLSGAADAGYALLRKLGTSEKAFVQRMNLAAEQLGMKDTHYADLVGVKREEAYTSLADTAILFEKLLQDENFVAIMEKRSWRTQPTPSYANGMYFEAVMQDYARKRQMNIDLLNGGKTGASPDSGYSFVSFHREGASTYLILSAKAKNSGEEVLDHLSILNKMKEIPFDYPLLAEGAAVGTIPLTQNGEINPKLGHQVMRAASGFKITLPLLADIGSYRLRTTLPESLPYPLKPGETVGSFDVLKEEKSGLLQIYHEKLVLPTDPEALAGALATPAVSAASAAAETTASATLPVSASAEQAGTLPSVAGSAAETLPAAQEKGGPAAGPLLGLLSAAAAVLILVLILRQRRLEAQRRRRSRLRRLQDSYAYRSQDAPDVLDVLARGDQKRADLRRTAEKRRPPEQAKGAPPNSRRSYPRERRLPEQGRGRDSRNRGGDFSGRSRH